jgi:hypothetical protein
VTPEPLYLGLKFYELLTLIGIIIGPITAVCITLWIEARRRTRDQQVQTLRMLVATRHLAGDANYSTAINMIPLDFNQQPKIMTAWTAYIGAISYRPTEENAQTHLTQILSKQTKLIFEIMKHLGYTLSETDLQTSAYAAGGMIERDNLMIDAWRSWPRIAAALESQVAASDQS